MKPQTAAPRCGSTRPWRAESSAGGVVACPRAEQRAVMLDEVFVLVGGEGRAHRSHEDVVELLRREPPVRDLVQIGKVVVAELVVVVDLEVRVGEPAVPRKLLLVREVLA